MLVLNKASTCDVCMEGYSTGGNSPHSISCGHVFCQKCLDHLLRHICPLCRSRFSPQEVRRLHIDLQSPTITTASIEEVPEVPEPPTSPPPDDEARILQNDIARVVKEGAKLPELRRVIEKCRVYYKSQSADQQNPVKISALLLWNLAESQRHVAEIKKDKAAEVEKTRAVEAVLEDVIKQKAAEAEKTREAKSAFEEVHSRLMIELVDAQVKFEELKRIRQDERDTAVAVETSLREHYDELDQYWKSKFDSITRENKALREELMRATIAFNPLPDFQRPIEVRHFHTAELRHPEKLIEEDPLTLKARAKAKAKAKAIEDEEFHLSPLAQVIGTWPSTVQSFRALVDEDEIDDLKKTCRMKDSELKSEEEDMDQTMDDALATPLPIPRSRQLTDSSTSSSVTTINPDNWSGLSRSRPDDIVMYSRPPSPFRPSPTERPTTVVRSSGHSPSRRVSREQSMSYVSSRTASPSRRLSREQSMSYIASRTASPSRRYSSDRPYVNRIKETYSRDSYDVGNEPRPGDTYEPKLKDQLSIRQSLSGDGFRDKDRERLRAQLHDILDSPLASSSLHISHRDEPSMPPPMPPPPPSSLQISHRDEPSMPPPMPPPPPSSLHISHRDEPSMPPPMPLPSSSTIPRSTTASSRVQTPLRTISMSQQALSISSTPCPEEGHPAPVVPKPLVHASSVAMQQEKERRERERQRELERERADRERERRDRDRDRERERESEWHYSSLKDTTNAPPDAYHYRERISSRVKLANSVAAVAHG